MATTTTKQKPETQYRVTMRIDGSKVEAVAQMTKGRVGGVTVEKVEKIEPFVPGEWKRLNYGDPGTGRWDDDYIGKPMDRWVNTDGRIIDKTRRLAPGQEKKSSSEKRTFIDAYVTKDEYGVIDLVDTLDEANKLVRSTSPTEEILAAADEMAQRILSAETYDADDAETAREYLAMRRIKVEKDSETDEEGGRCKPQYEVTLLVEGSVFDKVERDAKAVFGDKLKTVTKVRINVSRDMELMRAKDHAEAAAEIVGNLKNDMEEWRDNTPDSLQNTETYSQVEECQSSLESLEWELGNLNFDEIDFPQMFGG